MHITHFEGHFLRCIYWNKVVLHVLYISIHKDSRSRQTGKVPKILRRSSLIHPVRPVAVLFRFDLEGPEQLNQ